MGTPLGSEPGDATGVTRGRGGFYRGTNDIAYVTDPTGAVVKSGPRKGQPKRVAYGSPSNVGKLIENTYNLQKWGERREALGAALALVDWDVDLLTSIRSLADLDPESDEFRSAADGVVVALKRLAQTGLAADRGTHAHAIAEDDDEGRDWIARAEAGENLGIPADVQGQLVEAWRAMLERNRLEVLAAEIACVNDHYRLAGTLDRIVRLSVDLRFTLTTGEIVTVPAGTVCVLDIKTGQLRADANGYPKYWHSYAIQIDGYATSVPYDTELEVRGEWAWPVSQDHALIAHLDVLAALNGDPRCDLIYVDLNLARTYGTATVMAARSWASRDDLFSIRQIVQPEPSGGSASAGETGGDPPPASPPVTIDARQQPCSSLRQGAAAALDPDPADPQAEPVTGSVTQHTGPVESPASGVPDATSTGTPDRAAVVAALGTSPAEGGTVDPGDFRDLEAVYRPLGDDAKRWMFELLRDTARAGLDARANHVKTVRRFEIYRGLIALMAAGHNDDDIVRALVAYTLGNEAPLSPHITCGHAVGALDADAAGRFAQACVDFCDDRLNAMPVQPDGLLRLTAA